MLMRFQQKQLPEGSLVSHLHYEGIVEASKLDTTLSRYNAILTRDRTSPRKNVLAMHRAVRR